MNREFNDYALQPQRPPSDLYNYSNMNSISLTKYRHKHKESNPTKNVIVYKNWSIES